MKAKEYYQTYVAVLPHQINGIVFSKMLSDMFAVFFEEMKAATKPLQREASILAKVREFDKKWTAIATLSKEHFKLQANYRRPHNDDFSLIDTYDLDAMEQLFQAWLQERQPLIHRRLHETFVARDRLAMGARPRFVSGHEDSLWCGILSLCRQF